MNRDKIPPELKRSFVQMDMLKKKIMLQDSFWKDMQSLSSEIAHDKTMKRLQCRSFPLGAEIILDGKHIGEVTPHTFEDLEAGKHTVEMHYVEPATAKVIAKKEEVVIKEGHRVVCKMYFKEPKTLA